jgi:hypothetical protein
MVVFRVSVGVGFVGYMMLLLEFTGLGLLFRAVLGPGASLTGVYAQETAGGACRTDSRGVAGWLAGCRQWQDGSVGVLFLYLPAMLLLRLAP